MNITCSAGFFRIGDNIMLQEEQYIVTLIEGNEIVLERFEFRQFLIKRRFKGKR